MSTLLGCAVRLVLGVCLTLAASSLPAKERTVDSALLLELFDRAKDDPKLSKVLAQPDRYDLQVLWTRVDASAKLKPERHGYRLDPEHWFSPASTIKLPLAIMALEALAGARLPRTAELRVEYPKDCVPAPASAIVAPDWEPIERSLRRLFVVSDNEAANRLYQWLGGDVAQAYFDRWQMPDARLIRPLMVCSDRARARVGSVRIRAKGEQGLSLPERSAGRRAPFAYGRVLRGKAWLENGVLTPGPRDFTDSNFLSLESAQQALSMVVRPDLLPPEQRSRMREADRLWLKEVLASTPDQSKDPEYPAADYPRNYAKFFLVGDGEPWPEGVRIYNKIGEAYGYLTDVAYIEHEEKGVQFLLAATLSVDEDGTLNDGVYAYESVGYPFLAALGRLIYRYELANSPKSH